MLVGNDPGQVPLRKLTKHVTKLGREIKPAQMTDVLQRIKALDANRFEHPDAEGPRAHVDEGHARQPARTLNV